MSKGIRELSVRYSVLDANQIEEGVKKQKNKAYVKGLLVVQQIIQDARVMYRFF